MFDTHTHKFVGLLHPFEKWMCPAAFYILIIACIFAFSISHKWER